MALSSSSTLLMHGGGGGGSSSPCAACKFLRRKCQPDCVFAPYFPPDDPNKFVTVHKVFGASNVTKLLNEIPPMNREDAVASLVYEAEARLRDPVYGCVSMIPFLQHKIRQNRNAALPVPRDWKVQIELTCARTELAQYLQPININLQASAATGIIGGVGCEQMFPLQQQQQQQMMMMRGSYDADLGARANSFGVGAYGGGVVSGSSAAVPANVGYYTPPASS